jgi:hypothetical protein
VILPCCLNGVSQRTWPLILKFCVFVSSLFSLSWKYQVYTHTLINLQIGYFVCRYQVHQSYVVSIIWHWRRWSWASELH